jgi:uncharacterized protein
VKLKLWAALAVTLALGSPAIAAPAMWEASDGDSKVWLFGSMHALPKDAPPWRTALFDDALATAEQVYFETDVGPIGIAAVTIKTVVAAFKAASEPWLDRLSYDQYDTLSDALDPLGIDIEDAGRMPVWVVAMQIAQNAMSAEDKAIAEGLDFFKGVDGPLQWALPLERKGFLETPGQQFELLAGGSTDEQIDQLLQTIDELAVPSERKLAPLVEAWQAGDVDTIAREMTGETDVQREALAALLNARNANWLPEIKRMLSGNHQNLIIVGAGHLVGPSSVIDLLQKDGYTVTRIQ